VYLKKHFTRKNFLKLTFILIGAAGGYAYYYFIGCTSGTCPISSNPYVSTLYGGMIGFALGAVKEE
jgi:xanthine/uracil permease